MSPRSTKAVFTPLLLLLTVAAAVQARDFTYTTNAGTITITGYSGAGGTVSIPSTTTSPRHYPTVISTNPVP